MKKTYSSDKVEFFIIGRKVILIKKYIFKSI